MTITPEVAWSVIGALVVALLAVIGWFVRKDYLALQDALRQIREQDLKNEREARAKDRAELRTALDTERELRHAEMTAEREERHRLELRVEREFVNTVRMTEALAPFKEAIDSMRADQRELFDRLHGKVDKP